MSSSSGSETCDVLTRGAGLLRLSAEVFERTFTVKGEPANPTVVELVRQQREAADAMLRRAKSAAVARAAEVGAGAGCGDEAPETGHAREALVNHAKRTILVDGDMVAWLCTYDPQGTLTPELIADRVVRKVNGWRDQLDADQAVVAFSDESRRYFRHDLMEAAGLRYKPNQSELPSGIFVARKAMCDAFVCRTLKGLEADDVLGILATCGGRFADAAGERVIVSTDKDLRQVPALHFNPKAHPRADVVAVSEESGDFNHMWQTLWSAIAPTATAAALGSARSRPARSSGANRPTGGGKWWGRSRRRGWARRTRSCRPASHACCARPSST
jgi:hypothetical protein